MHHHHDPVTRMVAELTGRSPDQHAVDPIPAAAHLPHAASLLRHARRELLLAVDAMRTMLINDDDLSKDGERALDGPLADIVGLARQYQAARRDLDALIDDNEREDYATHTSARRVERRYVEPGDTLIVVLPHTENCRNQWLAGRPTRLTVGEADAELDLTIGPGQLRLSHPDAGIYHDPTTSRLYVLQPAETPTGAPRGRDDSAS